MRGIDYRARHDRDQDRLIQKAKELRDKILEINLIVNYMFFRFIWYQGEKTMDASLVTFVPVPVELKGHVIGKQRVVLNEMIEISGTTIDPGSRDQPGFTIIGNEEGIEMAKQLISEKLVSSRYVIVLRSTLLHVESFVNNFHSCSEMYIVGKMPNLRKFRQIE